MYGATIKIESGVNEIFFNIDSIHLAHDGELWRTIINTVMNLMFIGPCIILVVE